MHDWIHVSKVSFDVIFDAESSSLSLSFRNASTKHTVFLHNVVKMMQIQKH